MGQTNRYEVFRWKEYWVNHVSSPQNHGLPHYRLLRTIGMCKFTMTVLCFVPSVTQNQVVMFEDIAISWIRRLFDLHFVCKLKQLGRVCLLDKTLDSMTEIFNCF